MPDSMHEYHPCDRLWRIERCSLDADLATEAQELLIHAGSLMLRVSVFHAVGRVFEYIRVLA